MPRVKKSLISTEDVQVGYQAPPELREGGIEVDDIEIVAAKDMAATVETERFMNEKVVVQIEPNAEDENAPIFVYTGHNGTTQYIKVGEEQTVKRKFLYSALMAKRVRYASAFGKKGDGGEFNRLTPSPSTTHRIHLVRDDNPQGGPRWVQSVLRQVA
jgi:hypothetical protein